MELEVPVALLLAFNAVIAGATAGECLCKLDTEKSLGIGIKVCIVLMLPMLVLAIWIYGGYGTGVLLADILMGIRFLGLSCLPCGTTVLLYASIRSPYRSETWNTFAMMMVILSIGLFIVFLLLSILVLEFLFFILGTADFAMACYGFWKGLESEDEHR